MDKIDLRIGEATSIGEITFKLHSLNTRVISSELKDWEYCPAGYAPLVSFLEEKHSAPVIITNGANQGLHAALAVLKKNNCNALGLKKPYWNRIPELLRNLNYKHILYDGLLSAPEYLRPLIDSYLIVLPNNPDGFIPTSDTIKLFKLICKENNIPLIHDAAYYTRTYLPSDHPTEAIGDMQIFSASKAFGLSSLRIGYVVVHNTKYYKDLVHFMEMHTVGVSVPSQKLFLSILEREEEVPYIKKEFEAQARLELKKVKKIFKEVNPALVELPNGFEYSSGMFAWAKVKDKSIFPKNNIEVLDGSLFGMDDYVRINLGVGQKIISEAVKRINNG